MQFKIETLTDERKPEEVLIVDDMLILRLTLEAQMRILEHIVTVNRQERLASSIETILRNAGYGARVMEGC